jgi:tripartite-type tricarboxylate transporter receptor subunit TctC
MRSYVLALALVAALGLGPGPGAAQDFPDRPVKIINPFAAGGATDVIARAIAQRLTEMWKQPVIVESRAGAGSVLGVDSVAKSPPDGHTLVFTDSASFVIAPHLNDKLPYDPLRDLAPLALCVKIAPVLAVAANTPFTSVAELVAYAKAKPDELTFASSGVGSYMHIAMEYFKHMASVKIVHVPYRGSNVVVPDLLAGRVSMYIATLSVFDQYAKEGKLKVLAAATEQRLPQRPDLPTMGETVPGYFISSWFGMGAPAGTPAPILDRIHADVAKILREPAFTGLFVDKQFFTAGTPSRQEFAALIRAEHQKWGELVRISGAKTQ